MQTIQWQVPANQVTIDGRPMSIRDAFYQLFQTKEHHAVLRRFLQDLDAGRAFRVEERASPTSVVEPESQISKDAELCENQAIAKLLVGYDATSIEAITDNRRTPIDLARENDGCCIQ